MMITLYSSNAEWKINLLFCFKLYLFISPDNKVSAYSLVSLPGAASEPVWAEELQFHASQAPSDFYLVAGAPVCRAGHCCRFEGISIRCPVRRCEATVGDCQGEAKLCTVHDWRGGRQTSWLLEASPTFSSRRYCWSEDSFCVHPAEFCIRSDPVPGLGRGGSLSL